jgi:arsenite-transporting ATPase
LEALRGFGSSVYGDLDAASILHAGQPLTITRRGGRTTLSLELPFADRDDLELGRRGDELLVKVGPYRRAITLPDSLRSRPVADASLKQGRLRVIFEGSADDGR